MNGVTKRLWTLGGVALLAMLVAACENKPAEPTPEQPSAKNGETPTTAAPTAAPAPAPAAVTISDPDLSTPADFEEAVEKQISSKNYKAELTTLETELAKDGS